MRNRILFLKTKKQNQMKLLNQGCKHFVLQTWNLFKLFTSTHPKKD